MALSSSEQYNTAGIFLPEDACVVTVRTEWNGEIVQKLQAGVDEVLQAHHVNQIILEVPGAVEIGFAISEYWRQSVSKKPPHAFITLGCVLKGDTPHFEYVCQVVSASITQLNLTLPVPVIFGVLTVNDQQQADERTGGAHGNKGAEAAVTALKMISLSSFIKKQI